MTLPPHPHAAARLPLDEARLRLAQEAGGVGLWEWEPATDRVAWDATCAAMFGIRLEQFEGDLAGFARRTHPDDIDRTTRLLLDAAEQRGSFEADFRAVAPDGTCRHLLSRGQSLIDDDGQVRRVLGAVVDVTALHEALEARARSTEALAGLVDVALELGGARSVDDLVRVVVGRGTTVLGADGGAICVRDDARGVVRLSVSDSLPEQVAVDYAELSLDGPLPGSWVARHGRPVFLPDAAAGLQFSAEMQAVYDGTGRQAWATLPLRTGTRLLGSLVLSWRQPREFDSDTRDLLGAFAAQCAQALDRIIVLQAEQEAVEAAVRMSETLQRSLLTPPPQPDHLQLAVHYAPAAQLARVGGDWYDAFLTPDGATCVVVGDVTGHDRDAAARMGAVRNLLRGTAYALAASPSSVLQALERAMAGLEVDTLATALLARLEQDDALRARGARLLRWSSAGHLPPLLLRADGTALMLQTAPDPLLGLRVDAERRDWTVELDVGDTVVLYTDGLVERRGEDLDHGLERLRATAQELAAGATTLDSLVAALLAALLEGEQEDDVALVAVRLHPQDRPRPPEAGPESVPD